MKQSSKPKDRTVRREAGIALALFAFSLPVTLGLVFFALDTANLYLTRQRLNKAVRVAASAYISMRAQKGWAEMVQEQDPGTSSSDETYGYPPLTSLPGQSSFQPNFPNPEIHPKTGNACPYASILRDSLEWNLVKYSQYAADFGETNNTRKSDTYLGVFDFDAGEWKYASPSGGGSPSDCRVLNQSLQTGIDLGVNEQVSLRIGYYVPTLAMGAFSRLIGVSMCTPPPDGKTGTVSGNSPVDWSNKRLAPSDNRCWVISEPNQTRTASMQAANVYLLLDISGSMVDDTNNPKINFLKQAAGRFIDYFNPYRDFISLIPFNQGVNNTGPNRAQPLNTFYQLNSDGNMYGIKEAISNLQPYGQTNPCDALIRVINQINTPTTSASGAPTPNPNAPNFVVLFTDGAPNVYRLNFCGETASTPDCTTTPTPLVNALTAASTPGFSPQQNDGWYGWTVNWGLRTMPQGGGGANSIGQSQVFGIPQIVVADQNLYNTDSRLFPQPTAKTDDDVTSRFDTNGDNLPDNIWLDENGDWWGQFTRCNFGYNPLGGCLSDLLLGQQISRSTGPSKLVDNGLRVNINRVSGEDNNYRINGPSYLVHSSFDGWLDATMPLSDRIPVDNYNETAITCGSPGLSVRPNLQTGVKAQYNPQEQYNQARYFASRVLDRNWNRTKSTLNLNSLFMGSNPIAIPYLATSSRLGAGLTPEPSNSFPMPTPTAGNPGCLTSLNSWIPGTNGAAQIHVGNSFTSNSVNVQSFNENGVGEVVKTAELPYYCAIRAADYLRTTRNVVVFVVGLGTSASTVYDQSQNNKCNDPMQNALDFDSRKDNFLRRLALAPEAVDENQRGQFLVDPTNVTAWDPAHNFTYRTGVSFSGCSNDEHPLANANGLTIGFSNSSNLTNGAGLKPNNFNRNHIGAYYGSNDPSQLSAIFAKVAKQILSRMGT